MRKMTPVLILLMSLSAFAQIQHASLAIGNDWNDQPDYGQNRDRDRGPGGRGGDRGRPNRPPPPPVGRGDWDRGPGRGDVTGPNRTVRWQDYGTTRLPKLISQDVVIDVRGQFVNEVLLRAVDNTVGIESALVYLSNGQVIDVRQLSGNVNQGREVRVSLDYRSSLRVERLVLKATSAGLIGSRGQLNVVLGLAY